MRFFSVRLLLSIITFGCCQFSYAQLKTNTELLRQASVLHAAKEKRDHEQLMAMARQKGWDTVITRADGYVSILAGVDGFGMPLYLSTENNIVAAATIGTNKLWPGGSTGLNLSGSSNNVKDKLAMWDGGRVRPTHVELTGRVKQTDAAVNSDHSTHVAGTLIASGVNPLAKGMSFGLQELIAYDFSGDNSEMLNEASNLLISNHSYGFNAGWNYNMDVTPARWEFLGQFGANEDYKFGYYSSGAQLWDSIAYNAPKYLIVKSAGNNRNENGPEEGQPYWRYNANGQMTAAGNRPAGISSNDSYDILSTNSTAKNILVVGAVNPISNGYTRPQDVVMSDFSSWGPTDDGRIKPDVVADGVNLLSSVATSNTAYASLSGTSMSSPSAAGSLLLLQEYYSQLHAGTFMRSATLKGLAIHTANEAGPSPGPDYQFGWGLLNIEKAAAVITSNNTKHLIREEVLNGITPSFSLPVIASGDGVISATISWTDPKAETVEPVATALDNPAKKLVNDLDIVIKKGTTVYRPWTLSPSVPSAAATRGDNTLDNVEKVELTDVVPGETYTIEVTHKNTLQRGTQAFSLLVSGVGGQAYCESKATNTAGARIDSVSLSNIKQKNPDGCTSYTSYTSLTGNVEQGQTLPLFVHLNSCDASAADKIVKVFVDANNDGDFTDAGENLATSAVINGNGDFSTNITLPSTLAVGRYTILRIVMQETSNAAAVTPCGTYTKGETQDYRLLITTPANDIGVTALVSPDASNCGGTGQYIAARFRNFGSASKTNFPVTAVIKQGANTIATLNETFKATISGQSDAVHTFQTPVDFVSGQTYSITVSANLAGDQNLTNNESVFTVVTRAQTAAPVGTAAICGTQAQLSATAVASRAPYNWYATSTATTPLATGTTATTTTIQSSYFLSTGETNKLGAANKMVFPEGSYLGSNSENGLKFSVTTPFTLKNARLYIGSGGKLSFELRQVASESSTGYSYYVPPVSTTVIDVYDTSPNSNPTGNDPADQGAVYTLNINFPEAGDYYLAVIPSGGATIFRNNNIATSPYPYSVPGVVTIPRSSATSSTDPNYSQKFYYYYYDMQVEMATCPSNRVEVVATTNPTPVITNNGNVLTSSIANGNQWYLNGGIINGATGQTYTATADGIYTTKVTTGNCTLTSNEINITTTSVPNVDPVEIGMKVLPNPAPGGQFTLQLETINRSDLDIVLVNTTGQQVYKTQVPDVTGRFSKLINPGRIAAGVYYLRVLHDKKSYIQKIIVLE